MKILQVVPFFTPARGGSIAVAYNLSKQLAKKGHDVTIITTNFEFDKEYAKSIEKEGVEVIPFHCIANIGSFLFSPGMKRWLRDNIKKYDIIHMHNFRSYQNYRVCKLGKKTNAKYVLQPHGSLPKNNGKHLEKVIFDLLFGKKILANTHINIALTEIEYDQFLQFKVNKNNIVIIPNGIDITTFKRLPDQGEFRKRYNIDMNSKLLLFLGRIHWIKGLDTLIDAFLLIQESFQDVVLVIAGPDDGNYDYLKTLTPLN